MNLLTKTTIFYLFLALVVFGVGSYITYNLVQREVDKETDYSLIESYYQIATAIQNGVPVDALKNDKVFISKINRSEVIDTQFVFSDTLAMHPLIKRLEPHQKLTTTRLIDGEAYRVELMNVFLESDDIEEVVRNIMIRLFMILGITLIVFSFFISRWLFRPFHKVLQVLQNFNVADDQPLMLPQTNTSEFNQLNQFVSSMTEKARADYHSLKEFSENASHEMQTPIAIARGKLDLLLDSPELKSSQLQLVESAQLALSKLSKLGQGLSLLSRIENQKLITRTPIDFSKQVRDSLILYTDLAELKGVQITYDIADGVKLRIESALADILIGNLLKNAIQHNFENGWIEVKLTQKKLVVRNSGEAPRFDTALLFERFRKNNQSSKSLGLGLSIVKKIVEVHSFTVKYFFVDKAHQLEIYFPAAAI